MALAVATGIISKSLTQVAAALGGSALFTSEGFKLHYNIIGRTLTAEEVQARAGVELSRPFALLVPDYPDGFRATKSGMGKRLAHTGTVWIKFELNIPVAAGTNYEEQQRWWDNMVGTILLQMETWVAQNPETALPLLGWHSLQTSISKESDSPGKGSFFLSVFRLDWGIE